MCWLLSVDSVANVTEPLQWLGINQPPQCQKDYTTHPATLVNFTPITPDLVVTNSTKKKKKKSPKPIFFFINQTNPFFFSPSSAQAAQSKQKAFSWTLLYVAGRARQDCAVPTALPAAILCRLSRYCDDDGHTGRGGSVLAAHEASWTGVLREHWQPQVHRGPHGGPIRVCLSILAHAHKTVSPLLILDIGPVLVLVLC